MFSQKQALLFFALGLCPVFAFSQAARYDIPPILNGVTAKPVPNPVISLCPGTATINAGGTCTPATAQSFTDITLGSACSIGAPVVLPGTNACTATGDSLGNAGFWLSPGAYIYCINAPGITGKCFNLTVPVGANPSGTIPSATITGALTAKSVQNVQSVVGFGAVQNCTTLPQASNSFATCAGTATDNTTAFQNAVNAACGSNDIPEVDIPASSAGHYYINTAITVCDGLKIHGLGLPVLYCPNGCFTNSGHRNVEYYNIWMWGNETASVCAITNTTNVASALNNHIHDMVIYNFGTGGASGSSPGTGGAICINSDSATLKIDHNFFSNCTADISLTAPSDTFDVSDNQFADSTGLFTCKGRALDVSNGTGANTGRFCHNNITTEGFGSIRFQSTAAAAVELCSNEVETSQTISNASNASVEFLGLSTNTIKFQRNSINTHTATNANFSVFIGNNTTLSDFSNNILAGYNTNGFSIGTGLGNTFHDQVANAGFATLYSVDYPGISNSESSSGSGYNWGCNNSTVVNNVMCVPESTNPEQGGLALLSTANHNLRLAMGLDSTKNSIGNVYIEGVKVGANLLPLALNQEGAVGAPVLVGTPTVDGSGAVLQLNGGAVGGSVSAKEGTASTGAANIDECYADSTLHALKCSYNNGTFFQIPQVITATSAAFATATTAGTCVQNVTAVTGAATTMVVSVSPVSTPGVGAIWSAFVSSAGNVTINECAVATSAGGTIAFNIRVFP